MVFGTPESTRSMTMPALRHCSKRHFLQLFHDLESMLHASPSEQRYSPYFFVFTDRWKKDLAGGKALIGGVVCAS